MALIAFMLDTYGGARTVVGEPESLQANAAVDDLVHVVPNLTVQEPIAWGDIPYVIERARIEFEKWLATRPNLDEEKHRSVTLYRLRALELNQRSLDLSSLVET